MSKICPKCNKEWPDEFMTCPLDGSTLVSKPLQPAGFNLNLGDANAISGGVNMSDNHSVSNNTVNTTTSNVDSHNVITNHITQVEREKTPEELKHEKELAFRKECLKVLSDGIMTSEEKRKLEDLQYNLGLDDQSAKKILAEVTKRSERKSSILSPVHQITFNNIKTAINANRLDLVNRLMAQMKAMVRRYSVEEIQFTYYMLQAVLHPKDCIDEYEKHYEDKYWQTFWSSIAYRRTGDIEKSELLVADVGDKWIDTIPQENVFILASVNALIDKDFETAKSLFDNISGEHSPYLSNLISCLYALLYGDTLSSEELKQFQKEGAFYINNLFAEQKRLNEEAEAKRQAEEKKQQEEAEAKRLAEEKFKEAAEAYNVLSDPDKRARYDQFGFAGEQMGGGGTYGGGMSMDDIMRQFGDLFGGFGGFGGFGDIFTEEKKHQEPVASIKQYEPQLLKSYTNKFGYLRKLNSSEIAELKSILSSAPKNDYHAMFCLGQLLIQENKSAVNHKKAYDAIKMASEHGVYEAGAFMAYFYLYGKVVTQDLDEAERRIKIDDDFKKNPIFVQMLVDLYTQKGNAMLADVWKSKLNKLI